MKCQELMEHGVKDTEELQQKLDNAQQRWNAVQVESCLSCVQERVRVSRRHRVELKGGLEWRERLDGRSREKAIS